MSSLLVERLGGELKRLTEEEYQQRFKDNVRTSERFVDARLGDYDSYGCLVVVATGMHSAFQAGFAGFDAEIDPDKQKILFWGREEVPTNVRRRLRVAAGFTDEQILAMDWDQVAKEDNKILEQGNWDYGPWVRFVGKVVRTVGILTSTVTGRDGRPSIRAPYNLWLGNLGDVVAIFVGDTSK